MSTSLHVAFSVVSGIVYFGMVIFKIQGRKMRFSESSEKSLSEKLIFGLFEDIFLKVYIFARAEVVFF